MKKTKFGIIGFGIMGAAYAEVLDIWPETTLAGIADQDSLKQRNAIQRYGCAVYESWEDLIERGEIDAVVIALPDFAHRDAFLAAAEAKKHILIEKPLAMTLADAQSMVEAVERAGIACQIEFSNRWSLPFLNARREVENGALGDIVSVTATLNDTIYVPTEMLSWAACSTPAWFLMSHTADFILGLHLDVTAFNQSQLCRCTTNIE